MTINLNLNPKHNDKQENGDLTRSTQASSIATRFVFHYPVMGNTDSMQILITTQFYYKNKKQKQ